jgi:beta-lactamase regulating signal transducer with metallopeptidase domain
MFAWFAQTTLVALVLAILVILASRALRLGASARHILWLVVLIKLVTPPVLQWPWQVPVRGSTDELVGEAAVGDTLDVAESLPVMAFEDDVEAALEPEREPLAQVAPELLNEPGERLKAGVNGRSDLAGTPPPQLRPRVRPRTNLSEFASGMRIVWLRREELLLLGCLAGFFALFSAQLVSAVRFVRRLSRAEPAPQWLRDELEALASNFGIKPPRIKVVQGCGSPLLWCLGPVVLVIPRQLLETLERGRWRGVLAHELAHQKRGDVWVSRALLVASWFWWWNPLFWFVRRSLEREAELACDAWAVAVCDETRRTYAETLIDVCSLIGSRGPTGPRFVPAPNIGTGGDGRFFERRLTMILRGRGVHQNSLSLKLGAGLLALVAMPMWSAAQSAPLPPQADRPLGERARPPMPPLPPELPEEPEAPEEAADVETPAPPREPLRREAERLTSTLRRFGDLAKAQDSKEGAEIEALRRDAEKALAESLDARRVAEERVQEAEKRLKQLQVRTHEQLRDVQNKTQARMREAMARVHELQSKTADGALREGGAAAEKFARDAQAAAKSVEEELAKGQGEFSKEMSRAAEQLRRAQAEVAEALGQLGQERAALRSEDARPQAAGRSVAARVRRAPEPPVGPDAPPRGGLGVGVGLAGRAANPEAMARLERRLDQLEQKFDAVLEELRAMRRESSDRGERRP